MAIDTWAKRLGFIAVPGITSMFPGDGEFDARDRRHLTDSLAAFGSKFIPNLFWRQDEDSPAGGDFQPEARTTEDWQGDDKPPPDWTPEVEISE